MRYPALTVNTATPDLTSLLARLDARLEGVTTLDTLLRTDLESFETSKLEEGHLTLLAELHLEYLAELHSLERSLRAASHSSTPDARLHISEALERLGRGRESLRRTLGSLAELNRPPAQSAAPDPSPPLLPQRARYPGDWRFPEGAYLVGAWFLTLPELELPGPSDPWLKQGRDWLSLALPRSGPRAPRSAQASLER